MRARTKRMTDLSAARQVIVDRTRVCGEAESRNGIAFSSTLFTRTRKINRNVVGYRVELNSTFSRVIC